MIFYKVFYLKLAWGLNENRVDLENNKEKKYYFVWGFDYISYPWENSNPVAAHCILKMHK